MKMGRLLAALLFAAVPLAIAPAGAQSRTVVSPAPSNIAFAGRVTDAANILAASQRAALGLDLTRIETRTRAQIVVATVPTLGGRNIAKYARELGSRWGIGDRERNDGIVILLSPNDQLVRIAVGYGLEGTLTDEVCQEIIDQVMLPEFREGRLYEGLSRGVAALNARL